MTPEPDQTAPGAGTKPAVQQPAKPRQSRVPACPYGAPASRMPSWLPPSTLPGLRLKASPRPAQIGRHLGAKTEGDRVVTHLFESKLAGYQGWQWYAVLTRNSRSKVVTVNELGLLPSEDSILAPEWVPWAERVRPEDAQDDEIADAETADAGAAVDGTPWTLRTTQPRTIRPRT